MRLSTSIPALRFCILVLAFLLAVALNATAATKALKFGKLWDGHGTIADAVVIVENDKIQSVAESGTIPAGAEIKNEGKDVTFNPRAKPSRIALPSYAIITGPSRMRVVGQQAGHTERLAREQRDPTLFVG